MIGKEIASEKPITMAEVKELLEKEKAQRELGFEQQATMEHAQKVARMSAKEAQKLVEKLCEVEKLTLDIAVKLADMLPANQEQLQVIVSKERYTLSEKEVEQIVTILHGKAKKAKEAKAEKETDVKEGKEKEK